MTKLREGITVTLSAGRLSDLFFNFEHPARDKLYAGTPKAGDNGPTVEEENVALFADALEFCDTLGVTDNYGHGESAVLAANLVHDFMARV